jgi:putative nucleotidyltransferase with HDIG domain
VVGVADAVVMLGMATVEQLALITGLLVAFEGQEKALGMSAAAMQEHSRRVAETAARLMTSRRFAEEAYVSGLLHDIGKLVLACRFPESYQRVAPEARLRELPVWHIEKEEYGATHAEVGAYLLACWGLPRIVVEAVAYHHHPSVLGRTHFDPVGAVHVADALVKAVTGAVSDPTLDVSTLVDASYLARAGVLGRLGVFREIASELARR